MKIRGGGMVTKYSSIFTLSMLLFSNIILFAQELKGADSAVVFMYHRFGEKTYPSTNITLAQFKNQLEYLKEHEYRVWPLSKIVRYIENKKELPNKLVAITIDDAWKSVYLHAYPLLKEKGFPFTVFINTSPIDHKSKSFVTWEQIQEMSENGAEFVNHSVTHDFLIPKRGESQTMWHSRIQKEVEKAQQRLQEKLGKMSNEAPRLLSYPFGEYTQQSADFIKSMGYIGVTQTSGVLSSQTDLRAIPRFPMSESYASLENFVLKLNTLAMKIEYAKPWNPVVRDVNPPILRLKLQHPMQKFACYNSNGEPIAVTWLSDTEVEIVAKSPLKPPRDKYTCTAQASHNQWYWYSHLWILNSAMAP